MNFPKYLLFVLSILCFSAHAQNEAAIWYFGENAGLDFNSGAPVTLLDGALNTREGCATISDINGSLLFYTDGITVWDRNHQPMPNGTGLFGHPSSTQSAIIVPHPGNPDQFYIFTADELKKINGINYSLVDISLNGGFGDIIQKNIQLLTPATEKLTAVTHTNGTDVWVLTHDAYGDGFYAYRVSPAGVDINPVITNIGINLTTFFFENSPHAAGYIKASPDGTKVGISHPGLALELLDFDKTTGIFSNARNLLYFSEGWKQFYGVEFSPSNRFLYTCSNTMGEIAQFDTEAMDVRTSKVQLNTNASSVGAMQLGLDGRIYLADFEQATLSVIENPNLKGLACTLNYHSIDLGGNRSVLGLPPFITSYFQVDIQVEGLCEGSPTVFNSAISSAPISTLWDFGDGNTSSLENPTHTYLTAGDYTVSVTVTTSTETRTETKDITIFATPLANTPMDLMECETSVPYTVSLISFDAAVLGTQDPNLFRVNYFLSQADADANTNALVVTHSFEYGTHPVYARVSNNNNAQCYATTQFNITVRQAPTTNDIADWTVCDDDTDGFYTFDLSLKNEEILNGQDETRFEILYFASQIAADAGTDPLLVNYTNTLPTEEIFVRFQNSAQPSCYSTGNFMIEVSLGVVANTPADLEVCDDDNDGFYTFDFTETETEITGVQNPNSLGISYHLNANDANLGENPLNRDFTNTTVNEQVIHVRVQNIGDSSCFDTTFFTLRVFDSPRLQTLEDWIVCDDDNDGVYTFDLNEKNAEILGNQDRTDFNVSYYENPVDAQLNQNRILGDYKNTSDLQLLYYRLENALNPTCVVTDSFQIQVLDTPFALPPAPIITCQTTDSEQQDINLDQRTNEVLGTQDENLFEVSYHSSESDAENNLNALSSSAFTMSLAEQTVYARVSSNQLATCYAITSLGIIRNPLPRPSIEERYVICPESPVLTIDAGEFETWSWQTRDGIEVANTRTFQVSQLGEYQLTVSRTLNGVSCDATTLFEVLSSGAPEAMSVETNGFSDQIGVVVTATGTGPFEYSIDGENYQGVNEFTVFPGTYTVYVRDILACRTLTDNITAIGYQRFFTPNGDGINEFWNIIGTALYPNAELHIFDRYGKLVAQIDGNSEGWDGTMNGTPMIASDYWFQYTYGDNQVMTGHFTLKR